MIIKTELKDLLKNRRNTEFKYKNVFFFTRECTSDLRFVYSYKNELTQDLCYLGLYSIDKEGFVFINNISMFLAQGFYIGNGSGATPTLDVLIKELKKLIRTEIRNYVDGNNMMRGKENDLSDAKYQKKIEDKVIEALTNNRKPGVRIDLSSVDEIRNVSLDDLVEMINDIHDKAYEIAEDVIENNIDYNEKLILQKDVLIKYNQVIKDNKHELYAKSLIQKLSKESKMYKIRFKSLTDAITENEIKINAEKILEYPIRNIDRVYEGNKIIYDSKNYNIGDLEEYEYWLSMNPKMAMYLPETLANNKGFVIKLCKQFSKNYDFYSVIGKTLMDDKDFVVSMMSTKADIINVDRFYQYLSDNLKVDEDIIKTTLKARYVDTNFFKPELTEVFSKEIFNNKVFVENIISNGDVYDINNLFEVNPDLLNESYVIDCVEIAVLNNWLCKNDKLDVKIVEKITDPLVIENMIINQNVDGDSVPYFTEPVINNPDILSAIQNSKMGTSFGGGFAKIYNKLKPNNRVYEVISYLLCNYTKYGELETEINNSIGFENFHKDTALQKKLMEQSRRGVFLSLGSLKLFDEKVIEDSTFKDGYLSVNSYLMIIDKINEEKMLKYLENNSSCYTHRDVLRNQTKYSDTFIKDYVNAIPNCAALHNIELNYETKHIAPELSKKESIIPFIWDKRYYGYSSKFLIDDKEIVMNSLKHNFDHFSLIKKAYASVDNYSILNDKDFILECINTFSKPKQLEDMILHLQSQKIELIKDSEVVSEILSKDISLIKNFKRNIYNDTNTITEAIKKSKNSKSEILKALTDVKSKLVKDKDILKLIK